MKMLRKSMLLFLSLIAVLVCAVPQAHATPIAHLTLKSEYGDYIGRGGSYDITYTQSNSYFFSAQVRRTISSSKDPAELLFVMGAPKGGGDDTFALLFFGTDQLGIPIQHGFYANAERADFASLGHPGLDISFQGRGSNTVSGNFAINDVIYSQDAVATTGSPIDFFSATFEQHSEGAIPALYGTFTYDASGNHTVPEPSIFLLLSVGCISMGLLREIARI